jgi:hypothetical protein
VSSRSTYAGGAVASVTAPVTVSNYTGAATPVDPWTVAIPGAYAAGTAGNILGVRVDAAISSRSTYAGGMVSSVSSPVTVGGYSGAATPVDPWTSAVPGPYGIGTAGAILGKNLDAAVSTRSTYAGGPVASVTGAVASVTAPVTVGTVGDKTGYSLASTGLDAVSTAAPAGVAGTFREMMVAVWRRLFRYSTKSELTGQIVTYADDGTTVLTTQNFTDDGAGNEMLGAAR